VYGETGLKALGVGATNEGTSRLRRDYSQEPWMKRARLKSYAKHSDPQRRAKIAAAKRGKPRPPCDRGDEQRLAGKEPHR
jgi:hypothetical protein